MRAGRFSLALAAFAALAGSGCFFRGPEPRTTPDDPHASTLYDPHAGEETSQAAIQGVPAEDPAPAESEEPGDTTNTPPASPPILASGAAAKRYAALEPGACETELQRRKIGFDKVGEARGVLAPVRLTGPLSGVDFHSMLPPAQRRTSPYEIYDCRLVLALDDYAKILGRYEITEVIHYSVYRPPSSKVVLHGPGRRHSGALAIDAALFKTKDGKSISVEKDFHGRIGAKTCGAGAANPSSLPANAATLRKLVCEAVDAQLFNVMLTPDYNWQHRNHFHLEVTAGAKWMFIR